MKRLSKADSRMMKLGFDPETVRQWKRSSSEARIAWLGTALEVARFSKKSLPQRRPSR